MAADSRRRPPALKHGLSSRHAREEWSTPVLDLADAILGPSPREPQIVEAAREEAEAIIYVYRVQQWRRASIEEIAITQVAANDAIRAAAERLSRAVKLSGAEECRRLRDELRAAHDAEWIASVEFLAEAVLGRTMTAAAKDLRRLDEYERRALSLRRKALRRLDYERVEAERRRLAEARRASGTSSQGSKVRSG